MVYAFKPNGAPDTSFNGTGTAPVYVDYRRNYFRDVTIGPDQKIYAAGGYHRDYWGDVYRFTLGAAGIDYDETWDYDGTRLGVHVSPGAEIEVSPRRPRGRRRRRPPVFRRRRQRFVISHLTPQGQDDTVYGPSGMTQTDFGGRSSFIFGADIGDDGSVAMVAHTRDFPGSPNFQMTAARFQGDRQDGPTASIRSAPAPWSGYTFNDFIIAYSDDDGIDLSTLDEGDIVIVRPNGERMTCSNLYATRPPAVSRPSTGSTRPGASGTWRTTARTPSSSSPTRSPTPRARSPRAARWARSSSTTRPRPSPAPSPGAFTTTPTGTA